MEVLPITIDNIILMVMYKWEGKYIPPTYDSPPEYPELIIDSVCVEDSFIDIQQLLSDAQFEQIENTILANGY